MLEAWLEGHVTGPMNIFGDMSGSSGSTDSSSSSSGDLFSLFDDNPGDKKDDGPGDVIELDSDNKDDDVPPVTTY